MLGCECQVPTGNCLWWRSSWVSLSQSRIAFPSPKPSVVPHGWQAQTCLPRLAALEAFSQILQFSYPWKGVKASMVPVLSGGPVCWISRCWIWAQFPEQGCFLNRHKTMAEKCESFPCAYSPERIPLQQTHVSCRDAPEHAWHSGRSVFYPLSRCPFLGIFLNLLEPHFYHGVCFAEVKG